METMRSFTSSSTGFSYPARRPPARTPPINPTRQHLEIVVTEHSPPPTVGSILLASTNPVRLRSWYERALGVTADADGFLPLGSADLLIEARDDVAAAAAEPARFILNLHVAGARAAARRLDAARGAWLGQ